MRTIEDIRAGCKAATQGPWEINIECLCVPHLTKDGNIEADQLSEYIEGEPNRQFIANARQDIPDLLAELAEKDAEIEALETVLSCMLAGISEKDAEIEKLRKVAKLAGNLTDRLAEINLATDNARAIAAAMQYGKETAALAEALTEVGE